MGVLSGPVIDCHCHVYPAKIAEKATAGTALFYETEPIGLDGTLEMLLAENQKAGITRSLISSVATTGKQVHSANRFLAECARLHPESITAMGTLYPDSEDQAADVEEAIALGVCAIKLHPDIQGFALDDPRCMRIFELCEGRLPVLLHTGDYRYDYSNPDRLLRVLRAFPKLPCIAAHFGSYTIWQRAEELFGQENLWVDCSSSMPFLSDGRIVELIRSFGAERVLFGTDYPMWHPQQELERFLSLPLSEEEKELVLHKNAEKLFRL